MTRLTGFMVALAAIALTLVSIFAAGDLKAAGQPAELSDDQRFTHLTAPIDGQPGPTERGRIQVERFKTLWSDHDYGAGLDDAPDAAILLPLRAARTAAF